MSAPDADPKPGNVNIPAEALAAGQRTLAAIVFTDTVGFSARMRTNEDATLRLVARDLGHMKATCGAFGGQVLKSTGDGLLMLFTSAVQAVACALEIQRDFQKQNLELPPAEQLQHRIGIHLGDVFQNGGDVMGDGVNIAARLQTEAVPGGICLSKTVYDVVQNRLPFYVNDLGARKLKNIGMVTAYQISPFEKDSGSYRLAWYRWRPWVWGSVAGLAALVALAAVFELGKWHQHEEWLRMHPHAQTNFAPVNPAAPSAPVAATVATPTVMIASETEFQNASFHYMLSYDFDGMVTWIQRHDWPSKSTSKLAEDCPRLKHLVMWAHQQLLGYSLEKPLIVSGKERMFYYWPTSFGGVKEKTVPNGTSPDAELKVTILGPDQIPPVALANIIRQMLREDKEPAGPLTQQLNQELHLFAATYHLVPLNHNNPPAAANPVHPGT